MALSRGWSVALVGMEPHLVEVEVDVAMGLPHFILTALSDRVLRHVEHRVRAAVVNSGESWPARKVTVALLPAGVPKGGSGYDLSIALGLLAAAGELPATAVAEWVVLGELSLTGRVKTVPGVLPAVIGARRAGRRRFIVPAGNVGEARLVPDVEVVPARSLRELCAWLRGEAEQPELPPEELAETAGDGETELDLADVVGQRAARRAVEVAAAGGHSLYMRGAPGVGKTMLAERLPLLLPDLAEDEAMEVTAIHSVAGLLAPGRPLIRRPPFCAPHHSASTASIVGGGSGLATPGAVSIAHHGVLFLDEAPEFAARSLDALRQPIETGQVTLARANGVATYPCRFQLVLAANPCPCSAAGRAGHCTCSSPQLQRYRTKISGPLLDRIDINVDLEESSSRSVLDGSRGEPTAVVRERVLAARGRARRRLAGSPWTTNAAVPGAVLRRRWPVRRDAMRPLVVQLDRGRLSTRGFDRVLKLAWTLADLAGEPEPTTEHVVEAAALRDQYSLTTMPVSA